MIKTQTLFEIDGYHAVLNCVQNVYPVVKEKLCYEWGFKYVTGIFEFFSYKTKKEAQKVHDEFVATLNSYWQDAAKRDPVIVDMEPRSEAGLRARVNSIAIEGEWSKEDWIDLYRTLEAFKKRVAKRR